MRAVCFSCTSTFPVGDRKAGDDKEARASPKHLKIQKIHNRAGWLAHLGAIGAVLLLAIWMLVPYVRIVKQA